MKRQRQYIIVILLLAVCAFTACEDARGSTTLRLRFSSGILGRSETREVISPEGQSLAITAYTVSGTGPHDNSFSVSTNSTQVDINGLVIGTWDTAVTGVNQQGKALAHGSVSHLLTTRDNTVEVSLDEFIGSGFVDLDFHWTDTEYPDIQFDLRLKPQNGIEQVITTGKTVNPSAGTARYHAELPTGSYDLSFSLSSAGTRIAGGVVAIRILDELTSEKDIAIVVDKLTPDATALNIRSSVAEPVEGDIDGVPSTVLPYQTVGATFIRSKGGGDMPTIVDWYLDGVHLGTSPSIEFSTHTGNHRLDAIARTELLGSVGFATQPFRATVGELDGVPVIVSDITMGDRDENDTPYRLSGITDCAFLRDGRMLIASGEGLQLCEIIQDKLHVVNNFTSSGATMPPTTDPFPTNGLSDLLVDTADDLVISGARGNGTVAIYRYDNQGKTLNKIGTLTDEGAPWGSNILNIVADFGANRLFIADPVSKKVHHVTYDATGFGTVGTSSITASADPTHLSIAPDGQSLGIMCASDHSFQVYAISFLMGNILLPNTGDTALAASPPTDLCRIFLLGNVALVNESDGMYLYSVPQSGKIWTMIRKVSTENRIVGDIACSTTYDAFWRLEGGTNPKVVKGTMSSAVPGYDVGTMPSGSLSATDICHSPRGDFLVINGDNRLMLLRISDG